MAASDKQNHPEKIPPNTFNLCEAAGGEFCTWRQAPEPKLDETKEQDLHAASSRSLGSSLATIVIKEANWKTSD